jgi:hypothetical protein
MRTGRAVWIIALVVASFAAFGLALDGVLGAFQPALGPDASEGVLRTRGADGRIHETRLAVFDDEDGSLWIQSGHHFRGWYERLLRDPEVELVRGGVVGAYRAVPLETPEARARMRRLIEARVGRAGFHAIRAVLLFAEVKPVRLDPRPDA